MVTASHNPPRDNGYKVYLGDGSQIVPPADGEIAAHIAAVGPLADVPRAGGWRVLQRRHRRRLPRHRGRAGRRRTARPAPRLHAPARRRRHVGRTGARDGRLRGAVRRGAAGAARPRLPDRGLPQPRGAGRDGPRHRAGREARGGPRGRQRPGRRPLCRRRPGRARLADAARRRGRCAARPPPAHHRPPGHLRVLDRLLEPARQDGRRRRSAVRRDAHRLQVDQQGRRAWSSATRRPWATASTPST